MTQLNAHSILTLWETRPDQGTALLEQALPELTPEAISGMTLGQRDALLLQVWRDSFGATIEAFARCPACGESLEISLVVTDLLEVRGAGAEPAASFDLGGWRVAYRLPVLDDMEAAAGLPDVDSARRLLLSRCVLSASHDGEAAAASDLPEDVVEALSVRVAERDPLAEMLLETRCPACEETWQSVLEMPHLLRREVDAEARRLLEEVHLLAAAYGWHERDILAMTARRRAAYMEMAAI